MSQTWRRLHRVISFKQLRPFHGLRHVAHKCTLLACQAGAGAGARLLLLRVAKKNSHSALLGMGIMIRLVSLPRNAVMSTMPTMPFLAISCEKTCAQARVLESAAVEPCSKQLSRHHHRHSTLH